MGQDRHEEVDKDPVYKQCCEVKGELLEKQHGKNENFGKESWQVEKMKEN